MTGVFQPNVFQNNVFQVDTTKTGPRSMLAFWMGGAGTLQRQPGVKSMLAFWAGGAATTGGAVTPPVVTTSTPSQMGVGVKAWSSRTKKPSKKKRTLLEELDDALIELRSRIEERDAVEEQVSAELSEFEKELRKAEAFQMSALETEVSLEQIKIQLTYVREALREMDDEEALLLSLY